MVRYRNPGTQVFDDTEHGSVNADSLSIGGIKEIEHIESVNSEAQSVQIGFDGGLSTGECIILSGLIQHTNSDNQDITATLDGVSTSYEWEDSFGNSAQNDSSWRMLSTNNVFGFEHGRLIIGRPPSDGAAPVGLHNESYSIGRNARNNRWIEYGATGNLSSEPSGMTLEGGVDTNVDVTIEVYRGAYQ